MRASWSLPLLLLALAPWNLVLAENVDPAGDGSQYAWGENMGWVNAEPSGNAGPGVEVQDFKLTGWMWAENAGWISLSCENTASCATTQYGVLNDGAGTLSGYAWAENAGWIHFSPALGGVTIDSATGEFSGRAWGENAGWLTFASAGPVPHKVTTAWCQDVPTPPSGAPGLTLAKAGGAVCKLSWSPATGSAWYDVVRGKLSALRSSGGDFTIATEGCLADNTTDTSALFSGDPAVGDGIWFLVRGANCKGPGEYDSGLAQIGDRDAEIDAAVAGCP